MFQLLAPLLVGIGASYLLGRLHMQATQMAKADRLMGLPTGTLEAKYNAGLDQIIHAGATAIIEKADGPVLANG